MSVKSPFKPKGNIQLQAPDSILPGVSLPLEIRITTEEEIKPREVRAELVGEETYYEKIHRGNGYMTTHFTFARIVQTVAEQPALLQGVEQKWNCSLQIPPDILPSCRGKWVNILWTLKAVVDVPKRIDLSQEKPMHVFCPPPQVSNMPVLPAEKAFGQVVLSLKAPQAASAGDSLKGQLALQIKENLSVNSIRIELVLVEDAHDRKTNQVISTTRISDEISFSQNQSPSFQFALDIPPEAPPTAVCKHSNLHWKVRAVIDRKMKTDFNVMQELFVYNAPKLTAQ
jgi:hypothetical protein